MTRLPIITGYDPRAHGADCDSCPLGGPGSEPRCVPPARSSRPTLAVIAESPGKHEVVNGAPLIGEAGQLFDRLLSKFMQPRSLVHISHAILCRPPFVFSPSQWKAAMRACRPRLLAELAGIADRTQTAVAFGGKAQQALVGKAKILDWMGAPLQGVDGLEQFTVLPTIHPGAALRKPSDTPMLTIHFQRALQLARGTFVPHQWPPIVSHEGERATLEALKRLQGDSATRGFDVETSGIDALNDALLNVGLANDAIALSVTWYEASQKVRDAIAADLADASIRKYAHNGQFDRASVGANGMPVNGPQDDTMVLSSVVAPQMSKKLAHVACRETTAERWKDEFRAGSDKTGAVNWTKVDPKRRGTYNAKDASVTHAIMTPLRARLKTVHRGAELYANYMALTEVALKMRRHGIAVDATRFDAHRKALRSRRAHAARNIRHIARSCGMREYNPNANAQIAELFSRLGVRSSRFSEKTNKPTFDKNTLMQTLASPDRLASDAARAQLNYRRWQKLLRTYVEGLPVRNGRVHATWNPTGAHTGRWASQDPNMMNIPKPVMDKDALGRKRLVAPGLRDLFVPTEGREMSELDYSQLEGRILALVSGDATLLDWFAKGIDIHTRTAGILFAKAENEVSKGERELAKRARYAMHYGAQIETAWLALVVDYPLLGISDVTRLFATLKAAHPDIVRWHEAQLASARLLDYVEDPLSGRRYYFHGKIEPNKAYNLPIQMAAAFLINRAVVRLDQQMNWGSSAVLAQVHDSLLLEADDIDSFTILAQQCMEEPVELNGNRVIFLTDRKEGPSYGEMMSAA